MCPQFEQSDREADPERTEAIRFRTAWPLFADSLEQAAGASNLAAVHPDGRVGTAMFLPRRSSRETQEGQSQGLGPRPLHMVSSEGGTGRPAGCPHPRDSSSVLDVQSTFDEVAYEIFGALRGLLGQRRFRRNPARKGGDESEFG